MEVLTIKTQSTPRLSIRSEDSERPDPYTSSFSTTTAITEAAKMCVFVSLRWLTRLPGHFSSLNLPAISVDLKLDLTSTPLELVEEEELEQEMRNTTSASLDQLISITQSGGWVCQRANWLKLQRICRRRWGVGNSQTLVMGFCRQWGAKFLPLTWWTAAL